MPLARLQLNGALLLTEMITTVISTLQLDELPVYCWGDSTIVQSLIEWLRLGTLVKRAETVKSKENSVDCATRGISPGNTKTICGRKGHDGCRTKVIEVVCFSEISNGFDLLTRYSSFPKLLRLVAYLTRYKLKLPSNMIKDDEKYYNLSKCQQVRKKSRRSNRTLGYN